MPDSPLLNSSDVVDLKIYTDGNPIDDSIAITTVAINNTINKIPYARIEIIDGDMPNAEFPLSDSNDFDPGKEIRIEAGYGQDLDTVFEGIVVRHSIRVGGNNDTRLILECRDKAVKMTVGRKNANYLKQKDSDIIAGLIAGYTDLQGEVDATPVQFEEMVQYYCSDWDFMLSRAEVNGLLVICENGKLTVGAPDTSATPELELTFGTDLIELQADIDARSQLKQVKTVSWDPASQDVASDSAPPKSLNQQGDLDSKKLAEVLGLDTFQLQTAGLLDPAEIKKWAEAQQLKSGLARIRGRMKFQGSARAGPGKLIELAGVGNHFNGKVFVSSVNHQIGQGNWFTEVTFGMSPDWFAEQRDLVAPPAAGLLPGVDGLQIGVVTKLDEDPAGESRVQVKLPVLQADTPGIWARLASFYASEAFGAFFIPEIGDEVVLGYLNGDPNNPVILGSLYSSKRSPPDATTADNFIKAIVTRSSLKLEFDDDNKVITLETPAGNTMVFSEDAKSIRVEDQNQNRVELSQDGITLDSPKDISIKAKGKIDIEATGAISVSSQADVSASGMNVDLEAKTGLTAKGNATAELSASGQTTVKGAMVMIN